MSIEIATYITITTGMVAVMLLGIRHFLGKPDINYNFLPLEDGYLRCAISNKPLQWESMRYLFLLNPDIKNYKASFSIKDVNKNLYICQERIVSIGLRIWNGQEYGPLPANDEPSLMALARCDRKDNVTIPNGGEQKTILEQGLYTIDLKVFLDGKIDNVTKSFIVSKTEPYLSWSSY